MTDFLSKVTSKAKQSQSDRIRNQAAREKRDRLTPSFATYQGINPVDGTDRVSINGETNSGFKLISNTALSIGEQVYQRPNDSGGLQRVDGKNVAPEKEEVNSVIDILEFYLFPNFINYIVTREILEYTITLEKLGANPMMISVDTSFTGMTFTLNGSPFTPYSGGAETPISFAGDALTADFKIIFDGTDEKVLTILFYNGKIDKKNDIATRNGTLFAFGTGFSSIAFYVFCVRNKDLANINLTYKSKIDLKSLVTSQRSDLYTVDIEGTYIFTGSEKKTIKFEGYPKQLLGNLTAPPIPFTGDLVKLVLKQHINSKGHVLKNLKSLEFKTLPTPQRLNYTIAGRILTNRGLFSSFGDYLYSALDSPSDLVTNYSSSVGDDGIFYIAFANGYYNEGLITQLVLADDTLTTISGASLPPILTAGDYYFYGASTGFNSRFYLSDTIGGDPISITGAGSGVFTYYAGTLPIPAGDVSNEISGLNYTEVYSYSANLNGDNVVSFQLSAPYWDDLIYRYSSGGLNERVQVELTANGSVQNQYTQIVGFGLFTAVTFDVSGLADSDTLTASIRFKRELGSTWFQV
jgi:hypothetical protein